MPWTAPANITPPTNTAAGHRRPTSCAAATGHLSAHHMSGCRSAFFRHAPIPPFFPSRTCPRRWPRHFGRKRLDACGLFFD